MAAAATDAAATERVVVITGGTGGIGLHSAKACARAGARVLVTGRDAARGRAAVEHIAAAAGHARVEFVVGDVSSFAGVDALARAVLERTSVVDVLVNNAGYLGDEMILNADGLEMHFAVNAAAPWRLAHALRPALARAAGRARVVNVTAGDNAPGAPVPLDVDNLQAEKGFRGLLTMAHSKAALECASLALSRAFAPDGIDVNVVFPGRASTALTRSLTPRALPGPMKLFYPCMACMFRDDGGRGAARASRSTAFAALSPDVEGLTGRYFGSDCAELAPHPRAADPAAQRRVVAAIEAAGPGN